MEAAGLLVELMQGLEAGSNAQERGHVLYVRIKAAEPAADGVTHETSRRLHETWSTPFDRCDIHSLITRMDDILDMSEAAICGAGCGGHQRRDLLAPAGAGPAHLAVLPCSSA